MPNPEGIFYEAGKPAFVGVHGMSGSPQELEPVAKGLSKAGITCDIPILPGHASSMSDLKRLKWQDWAGFLEARLLELGKHHNPLFVGGLCSGALLALETALRRPELVCGLVLYSSTFFYDGWNIPKWGWAFLPLAFYTPLRWFYAFPTDRPPYGVKDKRLQRLIASMYARLGQEDKHTTIGYPKIPAATFHEMHKLRNRIKRHLGKIHTPTLLFHSVEDDLTSLKSSEFILARLGASHKRLVVLEDCYHLITVDKKKSDVLYQTEAFLKGLIQNAAKNA